MLMNIAERVMWNASERERKHRRANLEASLRYTIANKGDPMQAIAQQADEASSWQHESFCHRIRAAVYATLFALSLGVNVILVARSLFS